MTEYAYDPDFPYVVSWGYYAPARFAAGESGKCNAERYAKETAGRVIDTTPKPKIPEDAEYVAWGSKWDRVIANKVDGSWVCMGAEVSVGELLEEIGDAEVTVLVPKEES